MAKNSGRILALAMAGIGAFLCLPLLIADQPTPEAQAAPVVETPQKIVAMITCHGMIDQGLADSIERRGNEAIAMGADYLILEVETYGGRVDSADEISKYLIQDLPDTIHTVAYVNTEAISAGAMISVSCKDIIMRENTTIGCSAPIIMGSSEMGEAEREKTESFVRSTFSRAAQANGYPEALLKAMVSQNIEVWQIENTQTGQMEYYEKEYLPNDPNAYGLAGKKLIVKEGELLTLTDQKAKEYGIARAVVEDSEQALAFIEQRDGVVISKDVIRLETIWSEEMVRWLTSPIVVSILVLGIMLGIYVEFNTPGLGLPALLAVTCLVILVGSRYLIGMANWIEIALLCLGFLLLMVEIFVIPGFGVAGFAGIVCIVGGLLAMWVKNTPDEIPWPKGPMAWTVFTDGLFGMAVGFLLFVGAAAILAKYLDRIPFLRRFVLKSAVTGKQTAVSQTFEPQQEQTALKVGQIGEVISALRPAGKAQFGARVVDVVADGAFIEKGGPVKILEVHGNHVIVTEVKENA
ncbi:MAG: NfeD family protein [Planctomycetota bacterium]|jgi:membrane-bound serine protease (ClpP class)